MVMLCMVEFSMAVTTWQLLEGWQRRPLRMMVH